MTDNNPLQLVQVDHLTQAVEETGHYHGSHAFFRYMHVDDRARQWGMHVSTCGRSLIRAGESAYPPVEHPPLYDFDWEHGRALPDYQCIYIEEGSGVFETKHLRNRIEGGDIILLRPGLWHRYRPDVRTGWREFWVGFDGPIVQRLFEGPFFSDRNVFKSRESAQIFASFEAIMSSAQDGGAALQQIMSAQTFLLLATLYRATLPRVPDEREVSRMIQRARSLMLNPATQTLPLEEMAEQLGTSYSNFRRTFRAYMGMSPHQYRLHLKLSRARELLLNTQLTVKEITFKSGFDEEQYFCRLFKRTTGLTPTAFRLRQTTDIETGS